MARTRRLRTLLALWAAYWAGLAAFEAGPVLWEYLRLQATEGHGTVSWSFSGSLTMLALALFGPPLVLWALWLVVPEREERAAATRLTDGERRERDGVVHRDADRPGLGPGEHSPRVAARGDGEGALPVEERRPHR